MILQPGPSVTQSKIFLTSIFYIERCGESFLPNFNSVQTIVFDGMDFVNHTLFQNIILAMETVPQQVWMNSLADHGNRIGWNIPTFSFPLVLPEPERFLIFGAPLDIAIAANTKFDALFANRKRMSGPTSQQYKLQLIIGKSCSWVWLNQKKTIFRFEKNVFIFRSKNKKMQLEKIPNHLR